VRLLAALAASLCLALPTQAGPSRWDAAVASTFPIRASAAGFPVECTAWYAGPVDANDGSAPPVSVYVTAGHCPTPHVVAAGTRGALERTLVFARMIDPAPDLAVGARTDPREHRTFLQIAEAAPAPGAPALVVGYAEGHLSELVVTALPPSRCPARYACFHSEVPIRGGLSGAPIVSLDTGEVVGMLVATPDDGRGREDTHTVLATPASALRAALRISLPDAPGMSANGPFAPAPSQDSGSAR